MKQQAGKIRQITVVVFCLLILFLMTNSANATILRFKPKSDIDGINLTLLIKEYQNDYAPITSPTGRHKNTDFKHFLNYLKESYTLVKVKHFNPANLKGFVKHRQEQGEAPATINRRLDTLKHFDSYCAKNFEGYQNKTQGVKRLATAKPVPKGLDKQQQLALKAYVSTPSETYKDYQSKFLVTLLLNTGLRIAEARGLIFKQIDLEAGEIKNVLTKANQYRTIFINQKLKEAIENFLPVREEHIKNIFPGGGRHVNQLLTPIFLPTRRPPSGKPSLLNTKTVGIMVNEVCAKVGIPKSLHNPHTLRHTFCHNLLEHNDIMKVKELMGHQSVKATEKYLGQTEKQLRGAIESI